jgi:hypothetical protein
MTVHRNTRFFLLPLAAVLFALHFQLMPRVGYTEDHQTVSAISPAHIHKGDCDGGCCRGTACCIQAALFLASLPCSPPSEGLGFATEATMPTLVLKPLCPPPRAAVA